VERGHPDRRRGQCHGPVLGVQHVRGSCVVRH
jgi:hypothetical protein